jgi:hypothetical protein
LDGDPGEVSHILRRDPGEVSILRRRTATVDGDEAGAGVLDVFAAHLRREQKAMRAIALDGRLQPKPREENEQLFTLSEAAAKLWEMGYDVVSCGRQRANYHDVDYIEAELRTVCGCTKRMFIKKSNMAQTVRVPLWRGIVTAIDGEPLVDRPEFAERNFEYHGRETTIDGRRIAVFKEAWRS